MYLLLRVIILLALGTQLSCSVNILEEFGDTDTDRSKYVEAQKLVSKSSFTEAIAVLATTSADYQTRSDYRTLLASAYAGRCGLEFLDFVTEIGNIGTSRLYLYLMINRASLAATADNQSDCSEAITQLQAIGSTGALRTDDQNIFLAAVSFIQMGVIFSKTADTDNDGTLDGGFDACSSGSISDTDIDAYGNALMILIESISAVSNPAFGSDQLTDVNAICTTLADPPYNETDICTKTSGAFDASERLLLRSLIKEDQDIGLGQCSGDISVCFCP